MKLTCLREFIFDRQIMFITFYQQLSLNELINNAETREGEDGWVTDSNGRHWYRSGGVLHVSPDGITVEEHLRNVADNNHHKAIALSRPGELDKVYDTSKIKLIHPDKMKHAKPGDKLIVTSKTGKEKIHHLITRFTSKIPGASGYVMLGEGGKITKTQAGNVRLPGNEQKPRVVNLSHQARELKKAEDEYVAREGGKVDWRPQEMIPEDYYAH